MRAPTRARKVAFWVAAPVATVATVAYLLMLLAWGGPGPTIPEWLLVVVAPGLVVAAVTRPGWRPTLLAAALAAGALLTAALPGTVLLADALANVPAPAEYDRTTYVQETVGWERFGVQGRALTPDANASRDADAFRQALKARGWDLGVVDDGGTGIRFEVTRRGVAMECYFFDHLRDRPEDPHLGRYSCHAAA